MRLLFILALLQPDPFRERVDKGVAFPDEPTVAAAAAKSEWHRKVLDILLDRAIWAESLKAVEERTGLKAADLRIEIRFSTIEEAAGRGWGRLGRGTIDFDLDKLAKYEKGAASCARLKATGATVLVPPSRTDLVIPHELAHCFQGTDQPRWFLEGMASYVGRDPNHVCGFRAGRQKVGPIDAEIGQDWVFARGWAFFEWMESAHGADAVRRFIALSVGGKRADEAAAEATGRGWDEIRKAERDWSARWISFFKAPK